MKNVVELNRLWGRYEKANAEFLNACKNGEGACEAGVVLAKTKRELYEFTVAAAKEMDNK